MSSCSTGSELASLEVAFITPRRLLRRRVTKVVGQKKLYDTPDSPVKQVMTESFPAKYNDATVLTLDVKPGDNRQDYNLSTK